MPSAGVRSAKDVLSKFRIAENVYVLGTFETGLTIYNQQVRALNLAWSMVEAAPRSKLRRVAVVGGGFAGLTFAAALLHKGVEHVSLFEKRAALCPLQQGSDTRWVHPRIYDWPDEGSSLPTAALPLLNWNAGRASDVAVQVLQRWDSLVRSVQPPSNGKGENSSRIDVYLNVRHLRLDDKLQIEWVGDKSEIDSAPIASGDKKKFESVILAVGFGTERKSPFSYWRNETFGQPELDLGKRMYLVSGQGDGALIDLFRIRISRFRQDRILVDLFTDNTKLVDTLRKLKQMLDSGRIRSETLYDKFQQIAADKASGFDSLLDALRRRLRGDTGAILRTSRRVDSFKRVFSTPSSFQNRFLLFALYRAGGFTPTRKENCAKICEEYGIKKADVIRRHGTDRFEAVKDVMDNALLRTTRKRLQFLQRHSEQPSGICWGGGYWHLSSSDLRGKPLEDDVSKAKWRLEHLPSATEVLVTGFISSVAGYLDSLGTAGDFRVTLHRTLYVGAEVTLQQAAPYAGATTRLGDAGRTFGFTHGTIGLAAASRRIVRSRPRTVNETEEDYKGALKRDMDYLHLTAHSQKMDDAVRSLLAVPIPGRHAKNVLAVLYADSTQFNVFTDKCITAINHMCQHFAWEVGKIRAERVANFTVPAVKQPTTSPHAIDKLKVVQFVDQPPSQIAATADYLNIEFTDFQTLQKSEE
jgi:NAD(P)-binding Rossmann-like domain